MSNQIGGTNSGSGFGQAQRPPKSYRLVNHEAEERMTLSSSLSGLRKLNNDLTVKVERLQKAIIILGLALLANCIGDFFQ